MTMQSTPMPPRTWRRGFSAAQSSRKIPKTIMVI